ncbi:HAD-IA family hydrolase [Actinoplanes oblitus]|uniref:HAD-IA family hydrolase n=1 Tax=Actinoplanes oblitus TaxID=3040509 RepID=A0ABY8WTU9_9ACTN|nr:HAD-IA family hydrolase [Actinoplanes oblitus]WIN00341.1 HAD-IA family hydrolase [Actinoplanes oblitus]
MAIDTVVFDLGGVVCRYQPELRLRELARLAGREPGEVRRILYGGGFVAQTEMGYWTAEGIVAEIGRRLGRPIGRAELEAAWLAAFPVDDEVLDLVAREATRHRVAVLTNNDLLLREALLRARPEFGDRFGAIVFSAEIHAVKPAAESYRRALSIMDVEPSAVLFVDDSEANVAGSRLAGLSAVRFHHAQQLGAELERCR